jgi:hypothetical protein
VTEDPIADASSSSDSQPTAADSAPPPTPHSPSPHKGDVATAAAPVAQADNKVTPSATGNPPIFWIPLFVFVLPFLLYILLFCGFVHPFLTRCF